MSIQSSSPLSPRALTQRLRRGLSPTAIAAFEMCPRRFAFAYIERPKVQRAPTAALVEGAALHRALAAVYRLPPNRRGVRVVHQALRRAWYSVREREGAYLSEREEADSARRVIRAVEHYRRHYELSIRPLVVEGWVSARLPNGVRVYGKADRIDQSRVHQGIEVIDYKTGKALEDDLDLFGEVAVQVYALAATRSLRQPVVKVRLIYVTAELERSVPLELEDLAAFEQRLVQRTQAISDCDEFTPRPGRHCTYCPYASLCPASDVAEGSGGR